MKREVKIMALSYSRTQVDSYVCVLSEVNGLRKLPIIVKPNDAQVIALRLESMKSPRPMTHDLIKSISDSFQLDCQEIQIYKVLEGIFYARILMNDGIDDAYIESTAGDALSVALTFDAPIYVSEEVMSECGVMMDDKGYLVPDEKDSVSERKTDIISVEDLEKMLQDAIDNEDYELAAKYRDKINELGGKV